MAYLLYIDTSGMDSLVMILRDNTIVAFRSNANQKDHGQFINIHIQEIMNEANIKWNELNAICVLNGPGSYTGLRIGLGTAKGIAYAHQLPLILINKLDLIYNFIPKDLITQHNGIVSKAREDEYFFATYDSKGVSTLVPSLASHAEIQTQISENALSLFCIEEELKDDFEKITVVDKKSEIIANLCLQYFQDQKFADLFLSEPFYLKNVHINKINKL
jgi:tRNA threonylcarbamoyladenosine biosynthesis protein TsaB